MQKQLKALVDAILRAKQQHKRWVNVVTGLMAVVVFVTTYALILPAVTMTADVKELACPIEVHQHTSECYDGTGALICGQADYIVHSHDDNCYDQEGNLVCKLPEVEEHSHADECYTKVLTCTEEEVISHTHDDSCYTERLNCGYPEEEHTHSTECYDEEGKLSCGLEEHTHVDECYVSGLGCGMEEVEGHTHDENCYVLVVSCGKPEIEVHSHGTDCYETIEAEDGTEQKVLTCDKLVVYSHQHGDACFQAVTKDDEKAAETTAEPETSAELESSAEPETTVEPESSAEPETTAEPATSAEPEATAEPETSAEPETTAEPESSAEPEATAEPEETEKAGVVSKVKSMLKAASSATVNQWTDDISWYIDDEGTLYIEGTGAMPDVTSTKAPWYSSRASIKKAVIGEGITRVGNYNFYYCSSMLSVELPSTLKEIGDYAFYYCYYNSSSGLTTINLPEGLEKIGNYAFYQDGILGDVELPSTLKEIGDSAFYYCRKANIILSDTPITVGSYAFSACNYLQGTAVLAEGMTKVPSYAFSSCAKLEGVVIPSTVTEIGENAFYSCSSMTEVTIPEGVTTIGRSAFADCTGLTKVELPSTLKAIYYKAFSGCTKLSELNTEALAGLTTLGDCAFYNCSSLAIDLVIPEGITTIPEYAFSGCTSLKSVTLHDKVTEIGSGAFQKCTALTEINIPESVTKIGNYAFGGDKGITQVTLPKNLTYFSGFNGTGITEIDIPSSVTTIGEGALSNTEITQVTLPEGLTTLGGSAVADTKITSITLPEGLKTIGGSAFKNTKLTELEIPNSVTSVGTYFIQGTDISSITLPTSMTAISSNAFTSSNVKYVEIPDSVKTINSMAFYGATKLVSIKIPDSVTSMGSEVFKGCSSLESVELSKNIKTIPVGTFQYCYSLKNFDIPDYIVSINSYAFSYSGIEEVSIPSTVTSMGSYAFEYCTNLKDITLDGKFSSSYSVFYGDYSIDNVTINGSAMNDIQNNLFTNTAINGTITVGKGVDTLYNNSLLYLLSKRANSKVSLAFEGPNSFYYSEATATSLVLGDYLNINLTAGNYYVDENGVLYRLNDDKTATLVYCAADIALEDYDSLLKSITTEDGTSYTVTAIDDYAFEGNKNIESIAIPSNISSIGEYAFYNCTQLGNVNGASSLDGAITTMGDTSYRISSFWNTALTNSTESEATNYKIDTSSLLLEKKEADNGYKLSVKYKYSNLVDGTENQQLTGNTLFITISLDDTYSGVKDHLRVYFRSNNSDCTVRDKTKGTILGYKQDTEISFTTVGGDSVPCYFRVADENKGIYYVDLGSIEQGDTVSMDFSCSIPNWSEGGTLTAWIDTSKGEDEPSEVLQAEWVTNPDKFSVSMGYVTLNNTSLGLKSDGTEDGDVYLEGYAVAVSISESKQSNGANPLDEVWCEYSLDLPEHFYWNEDLINAMKDGRVRVYRSSDSRYYLQADMTGDGDYTTFCQVYSASSSVTSVDGTMGILSDVSVGLDDDDNIVVRWRRNNTSSTSTITSNKVVLNYNYENVIMADREALAEEGASTKIFAGHLTTDATYQFSDDEVTGTTDYNRSLSITMGRYSVTKNYTGSYAFRLGGYVTFYIRPYNTTVFPAYYDKVTDSIPAQYYIAPEDIESMLNDANGQYLSLEIYDARICEEDSRSSDEPVTDMNGNEVLVDKQMVGTSTSHSGISSTDPCKEETYKFNIGWNDDYSLIKVTVTDSSSNATEYTVGQGGDYDSIQALFDYLKVQIASTTRYYVTWYYPEKYKLKGESEKYYYIPCQIKDSFMLSNTDLLRMYSTSDSFRTYNYGYVHNGTDSSYDYVNPYITGNDYTIYKTGRIDGETIDSSTELTVGMVINYTNYVTNRDVVEGLPMVDKMSGAQLLLAPVSENPELKDRGLDTVIYNDVEYYKLGVGTYNNVKVATYALGSGEATTIIADTVTVKASGSGYETLIYWYLSLNKIYAKSAYSFSYENAHKVSYKAIIEINEDGASEDITFPLDNEVWLGDHQGHRLYDKVGYYTVLLSVDKNIVTNAETPISADHDPSTDELAKMSNIKAGDTVTYRLAVKVKSDKDGNSQTLTIQGGAMTDTLPSTVANYWSKDNVTVSYVAADGSICTPSDSSSDGWSISTVNSSGITTQKIVWNDSFWLKAKGTGYIYVTLKFPEKGSDEWTKLSEQLGSTTLTNKWQVGNVYDTVEHQLAVDSVASLQKGVYFTGVECSYSTYSLAINTRTNGRQYYGSGLQDKVNNNNGNVVVYYISLRNQGTTRLYVNDIQDVLPKGFTFNGLLYSIYYTRYYNSITTSFSNSSYSNTGSYSSGKYFRIVSSDYSKDLTPYSSNFARGTFQPSVETLSDGRQRVTFKLIANYDSSANYSFGYDSEKGMYYLKPDQTMVIMYTCKVGDDASTEDLAVNSVSMPFYSYNGGEVSVDDSEIITPGYANSAVSGSYSYVTKQDPNDGSVLLADREQASALSMNVSNNSATQWLVSQVNLSKGSIKPGITKSSVDSSGKTVTQALSTDVLKWAVNVTGGDEGKLHNYTVTDTMMTPYKFTGTATYEIDYKSTTYSYANTGANLNVKFSFDIPEAGTEKTYTQSDGSKCTVRLDVDESTGTQTLTLKFEGSYFDVPPGVNGKLTVQTENINKIYENKDYVNKAYLTPTEEFNSIDVSAGTYTVYDPALDDVENTLPSVTAEARVAVSYGYATTSYITITELDDSTNTGASNSGDNVIALGNTENTFRYVLNVGNSGGVNSPATAMSLFVMVDNLPEVDDHQTFYDDFERYSEFLVQFADSEEDLDLQVYITDSSGNKKVLDSSQYDVLFTELTSFEYADNKDVWQGKDLSDNDDWFTLAECVENGTLSKMRSIRVVLKDPNATSDDSSVEKLMPEKSTISVAFNAKINSDQETGYNEVAYNSFGYLYEVNKSQLQSATASVGVKTPGVPYLSKKLVSATGETFKARQDESFEYIIYRAKNQNLGEGLSGDEIFEKLKELDIDATKVTLDVAKGKSASDVMELSNLKCYVYDENSESWGPGDDYFVWADNESYTIIELPMDDDSDFEFASVNGSQKDVFTFGFVSATPNNITFTNKKESGDIKLTKVSDRTGETLKDALFALYTTNKDEALEEDETLTDIDKAEREIKVDDTTWYLMDLKRSDDSGLIQWSNLMETKYYVLEVEAPESYAIGDEPGQVVEIKFGSTQEITVTNYWSYYLPHTGGNGTMQYTLAGTALTLASAGALLYLKKKKEEQG